MKILIAGGSGFIGKNLSIYFSKKKFSTVSTYFKHKPLFKNKYLKFIKIDLRSKKDTLKLLKNFDVVVVCAGHIFNFQMRKKKNCSKKILEHSKINKNIFDACKENNIKKVIYISSTIGYPSSKFKLLEKDFFTGKVPTRYFEAGNMIRNLERYLINLGLNFTILRPSEIYGEYDNFNVNSANQIAKYFNYLTLNKKKTIYFYSDNLTKKSFLYVGELCKVIFHFTKIKKNYNTSFNVANWNSISLYKLIKMIQKMKRHKVLKIVKKNNSRKFSRLLSTNKLSKILNRKISSKLHVNIPKVLKYLNDNY